ncbi:hypothetical protein HID58_017924 [Brassica napus]|uniref:Uncharacterized protein n=2 Tax=Brassica TaxID=3705 RepID=A0ABQ8D8X5_BRANA|nr:hypothetical protein HID58_017924 [Brassica napus]
MGSCVSSPLKGSPFGKRPARRRNNSSSTKTSSNPKTDTSSTSTLSRRLIFQPPSRVLPEPIGDGIFLKYELGKELGRGEFGVTHECIEISTRERKKAKLLDAPKNKSMELVHSKTYRPSETAGCNVKTVSESQQNDVTATLGQRNIKPEYSTRPMWVQRSSAVPAKEDKTSSKQTEEARTVTAEGIKLANSFEALDSTMPLGS